MAGSWNHFVRNGKFDGSRLLENGGDVVEALRECYGMVWYLATELSLDSGVPPTDLIGTARVNYRQGLRWSPGFTKRAAEQNINWDGAWNKP